MRPHPSDIDQFRRKHHHNNQTIVISLNIKNIMLITHIIRIREILSHIRKIFPMSGANLLMPSLQRNTAISMPLLFVKIL